MRYFALVEGKVRRVGEPKVKKLEVSKTEVSKVNAVDTPVVRVWFAEFLISADSGMKAVFWKEVSPN
jgi:hypothetical protein